MKKMNQQGALKNSKVYLSGPIEHENQNQPDWRLPVIKELTDRFGIDVFDPSKDEKQKRATLLESAIEKGNYEEVEKIAKSFVRKDLGEIDRRDFLICYNPYKVPTTGTPCEVHHCQNLKKPVLIVCPEGKKYASRWYFGYVKHQYIFGSWEDCYSYLKEVDEYKHKDNHRWWLVYGMV